MKKFYIIILIILSSIAIYGQEKSEKVEILWGNEQKEPKRVTLSDIVGFDETGIYAIKIKRGLIGNVITSFTLEHYNHEMNQTKFNELDLEVDGRERFFEFIVQFDKNLYLFSSFPNQKLKKNFLYVQSINRKTLQLNDDRQEIAEINYVGKSKSNSGNYDYVLSRDSLKLLIYYNLPYDRGEKDQFGFHVFDNKMNQLWEKQITLPYKEELFDVEGYEVDNKGNVHLLGLIYKEKRKSKRNGDPNYKYQVLSFLNKGNDFEEYPIQLPDKFFTDMRITINDEQDIVCGGFYSKKGTFSIIGSYFLKIDGKTKEIKTKSFNEFGIDFITQNMTKRKENRAKKKAKSGKNVELYNYDLDNIILREDGGAILIGEQYYITSHTYTSTVNGVMTTRTETDYNFNDIIVININPNGNIEWTEKIPKRQSTSDDNGFYSSYVVSVVDDKLFFVFNDNPKNINLSGTNKYYNFNKSKESVVVLAELDNYGKHSREQLFNVRDVDILIRPKVCEQISGNELVLFGQRKKIQKFARVTFK